MKFDPWEAAKTITGEVDKASTAMQQKLARDYGHRRGWTLSRSRWDSLEVLTKGSKRHQFDYDRDRDHSMMNWHTELFDHCYFYRVDRHAAAVVSHPYQIPSLKLLERLGSRYNLEFEFPDYPSWWYPGHTTIIVCTGPKGR